MDGRPNRRKKGGVFKFLRRRVHRVSDGTLDLNLASNPVILSTSRSFLVQSYLSFFFPSDRPSEHFCSELNELNSACFR